MDLITERESVAQQQMDWLANWAMIIGNNWAATLLTQDLVVDRHYTLQNAYLQPGSFLGRYVGGAEDGFYGPWTPGAANGLQDIAGAVYSDFEIKLVNGVPGAIRVAGAIVLPKTGAHVLVGRMPGAWDSGGVAHPIVTADLPPAWTDLDALGA